MRRIIVIGGGLAGLRAAVTLADAGRKVTVLESRVGLGGRARSFTDPATGEVVDNGQHLFIGAYHETLRFLKRLGTADRLVFQQRLQVDFAEAGGRSYRLDCPSLASPAHLFFGMLRLGSISWRDKLGLRKVFQEVSSLNGDKEKLDLLTVEQWLTRMGQSKRVREAFWHPLAIATLNETPERASALGLAEVLRTLLLAPWPDARLGSAAVGLTDLYAAAAKELVESAGGEVRLNSPVTAIEAEGERITGVRLAGGELIEADAVIAAVPPSVLQKILPPALVSSDPALRELHRFRTAPIISINLWLDRRITDKLFVGLIGTRVHWLFNKPEILRRAGLTTNYLALIISAAHDALGATNEALVAGALEELKRCFPAAKEAQIVRSQVVRERDATVSLTPGVEKYRPGPRTRVPNLFLAGDWTDTGLPATIESAVVSGERAAQLFLKELASPQANGKITELSYGPQGLPPA